MKETFYLFISTWIFYERKSSGVWEKKQIELYPERENEVNRILNFIKKKSGISVFGIDAEFGEGKTVLIEDVENRLRKDSDIEFIKIRCILIEKDEVYNYIVKQLNKVLKKNLILSGYLSKLQISFLKSIESKFLIALSNIFIKETRVDDIENFKEILSELNKKIVIIIEDIDRGTDSEKIDKLLSFIDEFSDNNIKIIVNYGYKNLKAINEKYTRNFIEKYIPYTMTLSTITFSNILEKEAKRLKLDYKKFNFLRRLENQGYFLKEEKDPNGNTRTLEMKFLTDMEKILGQRIQVKYILTPRKVKILLEEVKAYLELNTDIEDRIIIGYLYLKHSFYDEFYEKIDVYKEFEESFPIVFQCDEVENKFTLSEVEILKKIEKNYIEINDDKIHFNSSYFSVGKNNHFNLDYLLEKLNIPKSNIDSSEEDIRLKFKKISEKVKTLNFEIIDEESKINYFIYGILNYYLYFYNDKYEVEERKSKINNAIKKLKYFSANEYNSSYGRFYKKFIEILDMNNLEKASNELNKLIEEYYKNEGKFENIFYMGENIHVKMMIALNIFKDNKRKLEFLDLIYFIDKEVITDTYIQVFLTSKINDFKISDKIIKNILSNNYKIEERETIEKIKKNINFMLPKLNLQSYDVEEIFNSDYEVFKNNTLIRIDSVKRYDIYKINEIKESVLDYENFIEKLEKIDNKATVKSEINISFSSGKLVDWAKEIVDSETEEIQIEKLLKAFTEKNKGFEELEQVFNKIEK